jgi:hypothetical protein
MTAGCNFDEGDCAAIFLDAGHDAVAPCDRAKCPLWDQKGILGCYSPCFTASCDFSQHLCAAGKAALRRCPLFDAVAGASYAAAAPRLAFPDPRSLRGRTSNASADYVGFARCDVGPVGECQLPRGAGAAMSYGPGPAGATRALLLGSAAAYTAACTEGAAGCAPAPSSLWAWAEGSAPLRQARAGWALELWVRVDRPPQGGEFSVLVSSETFALGAAPGPDNTTLLALAFSDQGPFPCPLCSLPPLEWVRVEISVAPPAGGSSTPSVAAWVGGAGGSFSFPSSPSPAVPMALAGEWGLAVGRRLPDAEYLTDAGHVEDDNSSTFHGAVAALRLWGMASPLDLDPGSSTELPADEILERNGSAPANNGSTPAGINWPALSNRSTSNGGQADIGCGAVAGAEGLLACFDFNDNLFSSADAVTLSTRVGDRFRPWCQGLDDGGRVWQFDSQSYPVDLGESWGFCPAPGLLQPLPSSGYFYDPAHMVALERMTTLAEVVAAHAGCGQAPLTFQGNRAGGRGGGLYRDSCDAGSARRGTCFLDGNARSLAPAQQLRFAENVAGVAGGAVFFNCERLGTACLHTLNATVALPLVGGPPPRILFQGNRAVGWGDDIATSPARIDFSSDTGSDNRSVSRSIGRRWVAGSASAPTALSSGEGGLQGFVPGVDALNFSLVLYDARSAVVRGSNSVVRLRVCSSAASGGCDDDAMSLVPVPFSPIDPVTGLSSVEGTPLVCAKDGNTVDVQFSVSSMSISPLIARVTCSPCPPGSELRIDSARGSWRCALCATDQYVIDSNNPAHSCHACPLGAQCNGSDLRGLVAGSLWVAENSTGQYRLTSCPPGYQLLNGEGSTGRFSYALQTCDLCPAGFYCLGGATPASACPAFTFASTGANSSAACAESTFLDVSVSLPVRSKDLFPGWQIAFRSALAAATSTTIGQVTIVRVAAEERRAAASNTSVAAVLVDCSVAFASDVAASAAIISLDGGASLNTQLLLRGLPAGTLISAAVRHEAVTVTTSILSVGLVVGVSLAACIVLALSGGVVAYAVQDKSSPEERQLRQAVVDLRELLGITKARGFVLSSEPMPLSWLRRNVVHVQKSYAEAAAQLLLFKSFDVSQLDGFCLCLRDEGGRENLPSTSFRVKRTAKGDDLPEEPYMRFCNLLLEVTTVLIRPDVCVDKNARGLRATLGQATATGKEIHIYDCPLPVEQRFRYFMNYVRKVRIWQDKEDALFIRLQVTVFNKSRFDWMKLVCNS